MLDKHIHRHVADCLKEGVYVCSMGTVNGGGGEGRDGGGGQCQFRANAHEVGGREGKARGPSADWGMWIPGMDWDRGKSQKQKGVIEAPP